MYRNLFQQLLNSKNIKHHKTKDIISIILFSLVEENKDLNFESFYYEQFLFYSLKQRLFTISDDLVFVKNNNLDKSSSKMQITMRYLKECFFDLYDKLKIYSGSFHGEKSKTVVPKNQLKKKGAVVRKEKKIETRLEAPNKINKEVKKKSKVKSSSFDLSIFNEAFFDKLDDEDPNYDLKADEKGYKPILAPFFQEYIVGKDKKKIPISLQTNFINKLNKNVGMRFLLDKERLNKISFSFDGDPAVHSEIEYIKKVYDL